MRLATILLSALTTTAAIAQAPARPAQQAAPPAPATKLEALAFEPKAGSMMTLGYDDLGSLGVGGRVTVEVREIRDSRGTARGLLVRVRESDYSRDNAYVDADEIPELLKGIDAIIATASNPTSFQNFEVSYATRGGLELTAYNSGRGTDIRFAIEAGRVTKSTVLSLRSEDIAKFRSMVAAASDKIATLKGAP